MSATAEQTPRANECQEEVKGQTKKKDRWDSGDVLFAAETTAVWKELADEALSLLLTELRR